jgi:hypothetical protein
MSIATRTILIMAGGTGGHVLGSGRARLLLFECVGRALNRRVAPVSLHRKRGQWPDQRWWE